MPRTQDLGLPTEAPRVPKVQQRSALEQRCSKALIVSSNLRKVLPMVAAMKDCGHKALVPFPVDEEASDKLVSPTEDSPTGRLG